MTDWEGIDGIRFKAAEIQADPALDANVKALASLVGTLCGVLMDQGLEHHESLEKQVLYLKHLAKSRSEVWKTLESLVTEITAIRNGLETRTARLDEALKTLAEYLPTDEERT